ncbi:hypothetical protein K5X82_05960 [Halosquirtibacter xylanolyticus]|uniref:beta-propeller domain-containing protein n=1 Tax=Halosquirtibacter xylanolyticus TaxID=3374599 RepID=UPI003749F007|nr:hypothetical protein K5X82_05960 [Prolixibacteraceae bacterium]
MNPQLKECSKGIVKTICLALIGISMVSCHVAKREVLIAGSGWKKIVRYDLDNQRIAWSHALDKGQECNEVSQPSKGTVLYSYKKGAKLIDLDHNILWNYNAPKGTELQSVSITEDGNILLGQCGSPATIMEYSQDGELLSKTTFDTGIKRAHAQLRRVRKTSRDTYLVPIFGKGEVWEVAKSGGILRKVTVGGVPFSIVEISKDHWMVSCGDGHYLLEINPNSNEVISKIEQNDIEDIPLRFVAESVRLSSGNTLICNWGGHARKQKRVSSLMEITPERKVVWSIALSDSLGMVSSVDPLWDPKRMK